MKKWVGVRQQQQREDEGSEKRRKGTMEKSNRLDFRNEASVLGVRELPAATN